jgi:3-methyladenine DNA glycosylase AlkD
MAARQKRLHVLVQDLARDLRMRSDSTVAASSSRYMRDQFPFLGVRSPIRRQVQKAVFAKHALKDDQELAAVLKQLWKMKEREFQYAAIDLADKHQHLYTQGRTHATPCPLPLHLTQSSLCVCTDMFTTFEYMVRNKSWWDVRRTLACLCTQLCG